MPERVVALVLECHFEISAHFKIVFRLRVLMSMSGSYIKSRRISQKH